ncbi:MAG: MFS transporter [Planctomycetaceae bacterium]|nr:MFS transporter [Planctomycetaceae bacterium]
MSASEALISDEDTAKRRSVPLAKSLDWYGWVMVVVASLAMVATLPGRTHGLGMITERLLNDPALGLTRTVYGELNLWATLIGSLFCFGIGTLIDRYGIRLTLAGVMLALGCVVLAMTQLTSVSLLFVAILLTRGFGQSALSVVSITIVGKWFDRNVSLPMALYSILMAGGFIAVALVGRQYADADWRTLWAVIGWTVVSLAIVLTVIARDRRPPADSNWQRATGSTLLAATTTRAASSGRIGDFTYRQALSTAMFWVTAIGISLYGLIAAGISLFNESILVDLGFRKEVYYESLAMGTAIGVVAKLTAGVLGIRLPLNRLLAVALGLLAASLGWLTQLASYTDVIIYVAINAVSGGMLTVLFFSTWSQLYGASHLGRIQGSAQMLTVIASAFGPMLFAQAREWQGSYHPLLWLLATAVLLNAVIAWFTPPPRIPVTQETLV